MASSNDGDVEDGRAIHRRTKGGHRNVHNSPTRSNHSNNHHSPAHSSSDSDATTLNSEKVPLMRSDSSSDSHNSDSNDALSLPTNHHRTGGASSSSSSLSSPHQQILQSSWLRWAVMAIGLARLMYYSPAIYLSVVYFPARGRTFYGHLDDLVFKPTFYYEAVQAAAADALHDAEKKNNNSINNNNGSNNLNTSDGTNALTTKTSTATSQSLYIPRIVHVTYKSREELPEEWKYSLEQWQEMNPDWEVRFWSDQDIETFVHEQYPEMEAMHKSYKYMIQRVDSVRYMILYHFGGVYSDMDIYPATSLDKLLQQWEEGNKNVLLAETFNMGTTNAFMAAAPQSKFMKCVIDNLPKYQNMRLHHILQWQHWEILSSAGSTYLWGMVGHCQDDQVQILAKESFRGCSTCDAWGRGKLAPTPCDTEWFHHSSTNSSWHQHKSLIHAFFFNVAMCFLCQPSRGCTVFSVLLLGLVKCYLYRRNKKRSAKA